MTTQPTSGKPARLAWLLRGRLALRPWLALALAGACAAFGGSSVYLSLLVRAQRAQLRLTERAAHAALDVQQHQLDECLALQAPTEAP